MNRYRNLLRFTREYVRPLWRWYLAGGVAVLLTNWMAVRIPHELGVGLDALRAGDPGVADSALHIGILGVLIIGVRSVSRIWFFTPARNAEFNLREDLFARCMRLQPDFYARYSTGDLMSRTTSDVTFARAFAGFALLQAINVVAALVMSTGQMVAISPTLTVSVAIPVLLGFAVVQGSAGRLMNLQRETQRRLGAFSDSVLGAIQGVSTIQGYCVEASFVDRLDGEAAALRALNLRLALLRVIVFPLLSVAGGIAIFLLLWVGGRQALAGTISAGDLAAFVALVGYLIMPLRLLGWLLPVFQRAEASLERLYVVLDAPVDRPELGRAVPFPTPGAAPSIRLHHLSFAYPDAPDRPILRDLTVEVPAGATVGIFGRTGSGKTTLLRVLSRLRNPPAGTVYVGGVDITTLDLDDYRRHLVVVPQTAFLFSETIRENVGLGVGAERVDQAVAAASLTPDLAALPEGMNTVVGERGIVLSGGQRQRVALARGLARDGEIVLLDDVLSAVDHTTEQELIRTLQGRLGHGATGFLVSHRMSALERCDVILVLDAGALVDSGTHAELIERPGVYRESWQAQSDKGAAA